MTHQTPLGIATSYPRALLLACTLLLIPAGARADDEDLAKSYFTLGKELFSRSDYEGAYRQFEKAYELSPKPPLLFNMARCRESLGQHEEAVALYQKFLQSKPDKPELVQARIDNLERLIAKQRAEAQAAQAAAGAAERAEAGSGASDAAEGASGAVTDLSDASAASREPARPWRLPGWITLGAGGALIVTGIVLEGLAAAKASELEDANQQRVEYAQVKDSADSGQRLETLGIVTLAVGGAAAVAGAVMLVLDARGKSDERRAWLAPAWTSTGALVSGGFSF